MMSALLRKETGGTFDWSYFTIQKRVSSTAARSHFWEEKKFIVERGNIHRPSLT
jgi:hypothetical protein